MIVYLHGFLSSPRSFKAQRLAAAMARRGMTRLWDCPQLPVSPAEAIEQVRARHALGPEDAVIGSSLGGYYATWLAEKTGCRAVLLNPAVNPARDLQRHLGEQRAWHSGEALQVRPEFIDELRALDAGPITAPERYFLVAARGDEVLDWREMVARYPGARQRVLEGSDHGLSDFDDHLEDVLAFALGR